MTSKGFDERDALEKLERFRADIERYRAERKALSEEFEAFVRSFNNPPGPPAAVQPPQRDIRKVSIPDAPRPFEDAAAPMPTPSPAPPIPTTHASVTSTSPPATPAPMTPAPVTADTAVTDSVTPDRMAAAPVPHVRQRVHPRTLALLGGGLILFAIVVWATWLRPRLPDAGPAAPPPDVRSTAPVAPPRVPDPVVQTSTTASELTTIRPVWVRVIADGQRVVERELPANARIPLTAEKTIVIRAGNAGAVRLTLAGQDQGVLGPEGTVVTRTFTMPRPAR